MSDNFTLDHLTLIRAGGTNAREFLHAQLSADIAALQPGESRFAAYCAPDGRVLTLAVVQMASAVETDGFMLLTTRDNAQTVVDRLSLYRLRAAVDFHILTDPLYGRADHSGAWKMPGTRPRSVDTEPAATGSISPEIWQRHDIQDGIPWVGAVLSGRFLPQMLALERLDAVDYHKGCYPGQEVIARLHYKGRVKQGLHRIHLPAFVATGSELLDSDGKSQGTVVACAMAGGNDQAATGQATSGLAATGLAVVRLERTSQTLLTADGMVVEIDQIR